VNGVTSAWFADTGAEIATITRSLADRMKVRRVSNRIRVGTTTADVFGEVGMIDLLQIGSASVENVPVLILPDEQLKVGNVQQIDGILGLPVFVAFGRIAWVDGGRSLALGEEAPKARAGSPKIYWHEEGLGVPVSTARGTMGAHLDTGANSTSWRQEGTALVDPSDLARATKEIARIGGAGGVVEVKQQRLPFLDIRLGPVPVRLEKAFDRRSGECQRGADRNGRSLAIRNLHPRFSADADRWEIEDPRRGQGIEPEIAQGKRRPAQADGVLIFAPLGESSRCCHGPIWLTSTTLLKSRSD